MNTQNTQAHDCVMPRDELAERLSHERRGKTVVFTNGCFDLVHAGHIRALEAARHFGDILVVGVNSDSSVRSLKGESRPIIPQAMRAELVAALKPVSYVVIFDEILPTETIRLLRPDVHVKSGDYRPEDMPETPCVIAGGGRVEIVPFVDGLSSTDIVERILATHNNTLRRAG